MILKGKSHHVAFSERNAGIQSLSLGHHSWRKIETEHRRPLLMKITGDVTRPTAQVANFPA